MRRRAGDDPGLCGARQRGAEDAKELAPGLVQHEAEAAVPAPGWTGKVPPPPPPPERLCWQQEQREQRHAPHRAFERLVGWWQSTPSSQQFRPPKAGGLRLQQRLAASSQGSNDKLAARGKSWWQWQPRGAGHKTGDKTRPWPAMAKRNMWNIEERRKHAVVALEAINCHDDPLVFQRWRMHLQAAADPEYELDKIKWLMGRLQKQGYNTLEMSVLQEKRRRLSSASTTWSSSSVQEVTSSEASSFQETDAADADAVLSAELTDSVPSEKALELELHRAPVDETVQESRYQRLRRERRGARKHRDSREHSLWHGESRDVKVDADASLYKAGSDPFDMENTLKGGKMGLLIGWLVGRVAAFIASMLSSRFSWQPSNTDLVDSNRAQAWSTPTQWFLACLAAAWLGRLAVSRMGTHPAWQIGCLAAWVFTLVG
eukprot:TRINITY_DN49861_c0_g1_i1.p1 TRINITY_DN49861_c0_g1~~TRINITY_DN49861_c0_g1_i1.p1  ORF type:complete len:431 (-),score=93.33 TRINITY_DN49861_c0_g1_i1:131-1423(-)